jgi:hypothetical protein
MKRRTFAAAVLAAFCTPLIDASGIKKEPGNACSFGHQADIAEILRQLVGDTDDAAWIGRRYLAGSKADSNIDTLLHDPSMRFLNRTSPVTSSALTGAFHAQRASDFSSGNVIILDNWMLARSEVHVCAVLALLQGRSEAG